MKIQDFVVIGILLWISYQIYAIQNDLAIDGLMLDHLSAELYEVKNKIDDIETKLDGIESDVDDIKLKLI